MLSTLLAMVTFMSGFSGEYDVTQVLPYYEDSTEYKLTISLDEDSGFYHLDWEENEGYQNRETGFEFAGYIGAYDFDNSGLGIYKLEKDCLSGLRVYPVVMRQLQVTSGDCQILKPVDTCISGYWDLEIMEGIRRKTPAIMNIFYRDEGYWDGGEDAGERGGFESLSGGFGLAADDILFMGFLDGHGVVLKMYEIKHDTLEGIWIETYFDEESGNVIVESRGLERATRRDDTE